MVTDNIHLAELINLNPQFVRSVNIERDFFAQNTIDNFLITRGGLSTFDQLARGVKDPAYRAQSISGPYGAGKSALAMQFARLLSKEENIGNAVRKSAKAYLGEIGNQLLPSDHEGYIAILATGTRESLAVCLLESLTNSLQKQGKQKLLNKLLKGKPIDYSTRVVVDVFEELASLAKKDGALGIIVIVDELGKLLEYAALHPDGSDIHLLQEMAEAASRSQEHPLWFITILHQEFSNYAFRLGKKHQQEWAKVQQRFFEIPCILDDIDSFQLISSAVNCDRKIVSKNKYIQAQIKLCSKLAPKGHEINFEKWALSSYPLHPTTLVLLPSLFRRFGQGERSLFSFISANEIHSLRDWIVDKVFKHENPPFLRLPDLYNYTYHTLIAGRPNQYSMKAWTEVEDAIVRLGDGSKLEVEVLKCIGLLGLVGDSSHTPASKEYLYLALNDKNTTQVQIEEAIKSLENKKLIVFRRFRNAFRLWEGSDIDINERLSDAYQSLPLHSVALSVLVARDLCPSPPIIARKHSFRTGMLRYFSVIPCIKDNVMTTRKSKDQFDGYVVQCLVENSEEEELVRTIAKGIHDPSIIVVIGKETEELAEASRDVSALEYVKNNTPALGGDRIARQELSERRFEAELAFHAEWSRLFDTRNTRFICYWNSKEIKCQTKRNFIGLLSQACDSIYPDAPILKNELINQRFLSSSASAARRNLIEAMIFHSEIPGLGITGYPPQRSIYESLLLHSGIHQKDSQETIWKFGRPSSADLGLQKAWDFVMDSVNAKELKPKSVAGLFEELTSPPFGVANGFAPILVCACLLSNSSTMAIYEDNVFVPEVALVVMERMMKRPEHFSILSYTMDGERSAVINRFSKGFQVGKGVLPVVRSLYSRIGTLPQYTLSSKDISSEAVAVRETILKAKSPERLLFTDLPLTLGFEPFNSFENNVSDRDKVTGFFNSLNNVFQEYINCYPALLIRIKKGLLQIFDVNDSDEWKKQVYNRALKLQGIVQDSKLRVLMVRAQDVQLGEKEYLESIGAGVVGQVPNRWNKADEDNFWRIVPDLTNQILAAESTQQLNSVLEDDQDGYLISISDKTGQVNRRVIRFSAQEKDKVVRYARKMLLQKSVDFDERLLLAALTEAARQLTT